MAFSILIVHREHSGNYINQTKRLTVVPLMVLMGPRELPIEFPLHHILGIDQFPEINELAQYTELPMCLMAFSILIVHREHSGNYVNETKKLTVVSLMILMGPRELPIQPPLYVPHF